MRETSYPTRISSGNIFLKHALPFNFFASWSDTQFDWDKTAPSKQTENTTDFAASIASSHMTKSHGFLITWHTVVKSNKTYS